MQRSQKSKPEPLYKLPLKDPSLAHTINFVIQEKMGFPLHNPALTREKISGQLQKR